MKKRTLIRKRKRERTGFTKWLIFGVILLTVGLLVYLFRPKYFGSTGKLAVVKSIADDVCISLYDRSNNSQTDIIIPGNTQVLAAYNLGTWKLTSLWKLGTDEKIGGKLIAKTLSMNFGFPVFSWWASLSPGDRLRLKLFSLINKGGKETILLTETGSLKKTVFTDGEKGYEVSSDIPERISSLFSDEDEFGSFLKAKIIDSSGSYGTAGKVGRIIETMGIKVASVSKDLGFKAGCKVMGKEKKLIEKVALILDCGEKEIVKDGFDLEIYLGDKFTQAP